MPKSEKRKEWFGIFGFVVAGVILGFYALQLSVPVISDETVTMANSVTAIDLDWSLMIASLGGFYYRYAQALMAIPFFECFKKPDIIYRATMLLQAIIQASIIPVVYVICRRHLRVVSKKISLLLSFAVCFVPSMVLYTFYFRGDYLLGVLPWPILLLLMELMLSSSDRMNRRKRICYTVAIAALCILAYMAHTRGIVLIIAVILSDIFMRVLLKKRVLHWPVFLISVAMFAGIDLVVGNYLKSVLYSVSGSNVNTFASTDMGNYFNIFTYDFLKDIVLMSVAWLYTLFTTTQGLTLLGILLCVILFIKVFFNKTRLISENEKIIIIFSFLVFAGYFAVGALFFKGTYLALCTGEMGRRVDRLIYDRYSICGAGLLVFVALYAICCKKEWMRYKIKGMSIFIYGAVLGLFFWKIFPIVIKYKGYIYNTITLNTFKEVSNPKKILSGAYYKSDDLIAATIIGIFLFGAVLVGSAVRKKWMPYAVLAIVLVSDLALIHVNYVKIRKASNDYVVESTETVVDFMQEFESEITGKNPYVLKGKLSGVKIQFYQSQLMNYKMFGKEQIELVNQDNYFIISNHDNIDLTWYEDDYYLFEDFDYDNAKYDIVYVKGKELKNQMEHLGYDMIKYMPSEEDVQ